MTPFTSLIDSPVGLTCLKNFKQILKQRKFYSLVKTELFQSFTWKSFTIPALDMKTDILWLIIQCSVIELYLHTYIIAQSELNATEMELALWVQILDMVICISLCTNKLGKGINPSVLPPAMGKIVGLV